MAMNDVHSTAVFFSAADFEILVSSTPLLNDVLSVLGCTPHGSLIFPRTFLRLLLDITRELPASLTATSPCLEFGTSKTTSSSGPRSMSSAMGLGSSAGSCTAD